MRNILNLLKDVLVTDISHVMPHAIKWYYRLKIRKKLKAFPLSNSSSLYLHVGNQTGIPILFLHGLYGHPFTLLHLADHLQNASTGPIFSMQLSYDEYCPQIHRALLKQAINVIEQMMRNNGSEFKELILIGHSMGAIEGAYSAFVEEDKRVLAVISIAGRLKVVPSYDKECPEHLKAMIDKIYQGIQKNTELPLYQIAGGEDWNAPIEATVVRKDDSCCHIIDGAMHFNVLYHPDTKRKLLEFVRATLNRNNN